MKKRIWLGSLFAAGALMVTGLDDTAQANEEEGAKTLWGEILPAETDPDGDGWANMGFDPTWMSQAAQDEINQLAYDKDFGDLSQVAFNEAVSVIWQREEMQMADHHDGYEGHHEYSDDHHGYAEDHHYDYGYGEEYYKHHKDYYHHWDKVWHDEIHPLNVDMTNENLAYLAMHHPEKLNSGPLHGEPYMHHFIHDGYEYHFSFDGTCWYWSYAPVKH